MKLQLLATLSVLVALALCEEYFVTDHYHASPHTAKDMCGPGNEMVMVSEQNLVLIAKTMRSANIRTAFIAGWNNDSRINMRVTVTDEGVSVAPHDDNKYHPVLCYGERSNSESNTAKEN